jgi:tetratricopeptide (TPR) repeat protein
MSPLGNKLARDYVSTAQLDLPKEAKEAEQVESSGESNEFVRQGEDALKARDYRSAVRAWRHAVVDDPKNGTTVMMLAQALFAAGEYDEAAAAAQQAMRLLPEAKRREAASKFREFYTNTQDYSDQLSELEKAVERYPNDPSLRFELGFQYAYSGHPDLALRQLDKLLELVPQDQVGRELRDLVNKEWEAKQGPAS